MKQTVRYQILTVPGKLRSDVRIIVDDSRPAEFSSNYEGLNNSLTLHPLVTLSIIRPSEVDENGTRVRAPWNPNDSLGMTKFSLPIFLKELAGINKDMEIPELYTYHGKRLEINEEAAAKIRRVFMIGTVTLELSAVVVTQADESRVEGIKMKFNNEQSSVILTLNELTSLLYNLQSVNVDSIAIALYMNYINRPDKPKTFQPGTFQPKVDIIPKEDPNDETPF